MVQTVIARTPLIVIILLFPILGTIVLGRLWSRTPHPINITLFALVNLGLCYVMLLAVSWHNLYPKRELIYFAGPAIYFLTYVGLALLQFLLIKFAVGRGLRAWAASLLFPLVTLVMVRYMLLWWDPFLPFVSRFSEVGSAGLFVGISYLAFRTIRLTVEVRNGVVPMPTVAEFLGFLFFCPTLSIGPITTYSTFRRSLYAADSSVTPLDNSFLRICKGLAKYLFLASLLSQISYSGLMLDGHKHGYFDLVVAAFAYYLFLYCNFSGFCDIVIGASGLVGLQIDENFRNPLAARNIQEFWSRWHMSLSFFMRDLVFQPMTKWFLRRFGAKRLNEAMIVPTVTIFLLIGIWHGLQMNYLLFGLSHGIGVVFIVYLAHFMRQRMGIQGYRDYMASPIARRAAIAITFCYVAATHFLFANTVTDMQAVLASLTQ